MMHSDDKDIFFASQTYQTKTRKWSFREVKRKSSLLIDQALHLIFSLFHWYLIQMGLSEHTIQFWHNHLPRASFSTHNSSAQYIMPPHNCLETLLKQFKVERSSEAERTTVGMCSTPWVQLVKKPELLLDKGKGNSCLL